MTLASNSKRQTSHPQTPLRKRLTELALTHSAMILTLDYQLLPKSRGELGDGAYAEGIGRVGKGFGRK